MENTTAKRASSRNRPPSRPTTPLRPSSRTSLRESQTFTPGAGTSAAFPLDSLEPAFAELSDSMADLEANFMHLQLMHESLSRFNENFASFLYGLNMNAFCVDFPEVSRPTLLFCLCCKTLTLACRHPSPNRLDAHEVVMKAQVGIGSLVCPPITLTQSQLLQDLSKIVEDAQEPKHPQSKIRKQVFCTPSFKEIAKPN